MRLPALRSHRTGLPQLFEEDLSAVESELESMDGVEAIKQKRLKSQSVLRNNSGIAYTSLVDDGGAMMARYTDGELVVDAGEFSASTSSTFGAAHDVSGR